MNVSIYLLDKTYKISKNDNKIHDNLQVTHKIYENIYLHSTEIIITHTNLQEKIEHHTHTMFNFWKAKQSWKKNNCKEKKS